MKPATQPVNINGRIYQTVVCRGMMMAQAFIQRDKEEEWLCQHEWQGNFYFVHYQDKGREI